MTTRRLFRIPILPLKRLQLTRPKPLSTSSTASTGGGGGKGDGGGGERRDDVYRQLENLDFSTAAKILLTHPPKRKKYGFDFHLVQFFFACLPSFAVYLVAKYARHKKRKDDENHLNLSSSVMSEINEDCGSFVVFSRGNELERRRKRAKEEERAKETALEPPEEIEDTEILKVKERLDALEEAVKEIAQETKKISANKPPVKGDQDTKQLQPSESPSHAADGHQIKSKPGDSPPNHVKDNVRVSGAVLSKAPQEQQKKIGHQVTAGDN
ncbi:hypothetical protein QJS10_CPB19g00660 [Acorus calamus]|uniref:Uncharacterized protein n=1 Tax=Acorus calamus TaxID=4465 RepID=A0AAV9CG05_ACOCL|nr:hypothetical protein QJS10_CPB19g00660 [Acorus calamus]